MKTELSVSSTTTLTTTQARLQKYIELGLKGSKNTQRGYKSDLNQFQQWCQLHGVAHLPCESLHLCEYLDELVSNNNKWATIQRALNAIRKGHKLAGKPFPDDELLQSVLTGIKRTIGVKQKKAPAFRAEAFGELLDKFDVDNPVEVRDKCLLLIGFMGAFRRSELVAINYSHLRKTPEGLIIEIPRSKTNQTGEEQYKAIFYNDDEPNRCPVRAYENWTAHQQIMTHTEYGLWPGASYAGQLRETHPLFVSFRRGVKPGEVRITDKRLWDGSVGLILKQYMGDNFSAHSLRASFVTVSKRQGADDSSIMRQTGHKSAKMIERYTRLDSIVEHNAASTLKL